MYVHTFCLWEETETAPPDISCAIISFVHAPTPTPFVMPDIQAPAAIIQVNPVRGRMIEAGDLIRTLAVEASGTFAPIFNSAAQSPYTLATSRRYYWNDGYGAPEHGYVTLGPLARLWTGEHTRNVFAVRDIFSETPSLIQMGIDPTRLFILFLHPSAGLVTGGPSLAPPVPQFTPSPIASQPLPMHPGALSNAAAQGTSRASWSLNLTG